MTSPAGIEVFADQPTVVVSTSLTATSGSTSISVGTPTNAFPTASSSVTPNTFFRIIDPAATSEIMLVTAGGGASSGSWTITRGADGTAPVAHSANWTAQQVISAGTLQNFKQASNAITSNVAVTNTTSELVLATYQPVGFDIEAGASFEIVAFGQFGKVLGGAVPTLQFTVYWGGSGSVGGAFTSTGSTMLAQILTGTNAPALLTTVVAAGMGFDVNGTLILESTTAAVCNMNLWYNNATSLATTGINAVTNNTNSSHQSQASAITISGSGPIILTAKWSAASASNTLTATAPVIYRAA